MGSLSTGLRDLLVAVAMGNTAESGEFICGPTAVVFTGLLNFSQRMNGSSQKVYSKGKFLKSLNSLEIPNLHDDSHDPFCPPPQNCGYPMNSGEQFNP